MKNLNKTLNIAQWVSLAVAFLVNLIYQFCGEPLLVYFTLVFIAVAFSCLVAEDILLLKDLKSYKLEDYVAQFNFNQVEREEKPENEQEDIQNNLENYKNDYVKFTKKKKIFSILRLTVISLLLILCIVCIIMY